MSTLICTACQPTFARPMEKLMVQPCDPIPADYFYWQDNNAIIHQPDHTQAVSASNCFAIQEVYPETDPIGVFPAWLLGKDAIAKPASDQDLNYGFSFCDLIHSLRSYNTRHTYTHSIAFQDRCVPKLMFRRPPSIVWVTQFPGLAH